MEQNIYEEYAIVKAQKAELEAREDVLKASIIADMNERETSKEETPLGRFSITRRKTWTYPQRVIDLGETFKAEKSKAESTGEATYVEAESLTFTSAKF